ncbi:uncharacterized protein LOC135195555 isoform X2 [Macrobrachium nipponense]|uniref:ADP-ribosylation factor1 n=1 Tax=Macrobrachium nipponense TaxID=159736 RepID=A0A7G9U6E4_MACNP|nr:ADP-ribosylation factor1 [Macrobrachium nipponense]QYL33793.1 Arfn [Macrobrachium nipponense]
MGAILSSILSLFKGPDPYRIVMVGLDGVGKTTILYSLKLGKVVQTIPTIGFNVETVEYKNISFTVWDLPSQCKMRPLWRHYFPGTTAAIFVVDSTDKERLPESREALQYVLDEPELDNCPLLIMANKQDLPEAVSPSSITEALQLERLKRPWFIQGTSALESTGICEALDWLAKAVTE